MHFKLQDKSIIDDKNCEVKMLGDDSESFIFLG